MLACQNHAIGKKQIDAGFLILSWPSLIGNPYQPLRLTSFLRATGAPVPPRVIAPGAPPIVIAPGAAPIPNDGFCAMGPIAGADCAAAHKKL